MNRKKFALTALGATLAINSYAGGMVDYYGEYDIGWTKVITLSGGPAWASGPGESQTIYYNNGVLFNRYINTTKSQTMGAGELYFALQKPGYYGMWGQLGLAIGGMSETKMTGIINVNNLINISNYQYRLNHGYISLKGKLLSDPKMMLQPYVSGSIGVAYNTSYGFRTNPLVSTLVSAPWFESNSVMAFTYSLGLGLQKSLNDNWQVGIGYEFSDWGKNELGNALTPWSINGPHLTHLYSNELVLSVSYLC